jgi:predicted alpha/beta-fold hydrolase
MLFVIFVCLLPSAIGWSIVRNKAAFSSNIRTHLASTVTDTINNEDTFVNTIETTQQQKAAEIAASFQPHDDYNPYIRNGHLQSILGFFLRETCAYIPRVDSLEGVLDLFQRMQGGLEKRSSEASHAQFWDDRFEIETPDHDWFHVDCKYSTTGTSTKGMPNATAPTVIMLHGLQSSSYGALAVEMARAFTGQGMNCHCVNFRGCSKDARGETVMNSQMGGYHLGFYQDLIHYLDLFKKEYPNTPIFLSGFSLGANAVLKCLGDLGMDAVKRYNILGAAVMCAPMDQSKNAPVLGKPLSIQRYIYTDGLLKSLQHVAQLQRQQFPELEKIVDFDGIQSAETITDFDDAFIAPLYGFRNALDYYRQTSSIHVMDKIVVPTMILNAYDDPFLDPNVWPTHLSSEFGGPAPLKMIMTESGGHLGFSFHQVDENDSRLDSMTPSWGSMTAASFLGHVHKATEKME